MLRGPRRTTRRGALLIRGPSFALPWVPALRCIVKDAAPSGTRIIAVQKTQCSLNNSRYQDGASYPTANLPNSLSKPKTRRGDAPWREQISVICPVKILALNAASRSLLQSGPKTVRAAYPIFGTAVPAITGSRRWLFSMLSIRTERPSRPEGWRFAELRAQAAACRLCWQTGN
jgi:hypothetical protein